MTLVDYVRGNPVVVLDIVKYGLALLVLFGLPIPPGADIAVAGLVVGVLSLYTRSKVTPVSTP